MLVGELAVKELADALETIDGAFPVVVLVGSDPGEFREAARILEIGGQLREREQVFLQVGGGVVEDVVELGKG